MTLYEGKAGNCYRILGILTEENLAGRLRALGVTEYTKAVILSRKKRGALIIRVRGTRLALGRKIAEGIRIEEIRPEETAEQAFEQTYPPQAPGEMGGIGG